MVTNDRIVTKTEIMESLAALGVVSGDIVLVHSSFKSLGFIEGGADTVIGAFEDLIGPSGTLVFPTLCQQEFKRSYETWHMDKQSDVGYLTNYFRKLPDAYRSDQATHSVAARGKYGRFLTETHGHTHKRFGNMGDTPFSADSPWAKMYHMDGKIVMFGVDALYITFRHFAEYVFIERCLSSIRFHPEYESMKNRLESFTSPGVWPHVCNEWLFARLLERGLSKQVDCGSGKLLCVDARLFVDAALWCMEHRVRGIFWREDISDLDLWFADLERMQKEIVEDTIK